MADILATGTSGYQIGQIDTASTMVDLVTPHAAKHPNGLAAAIIQIETILGVGTTLKGTTADLVTRLAQAHNADGTIKLTGFTGLTTDRGLLATSSTTLSIINHTPIGMITPYAGSTAPIHWVLCDGSAISRTTYAKLFAVISTTYGTGDGSTTFNVPDLRGRIPIGVDGSANRITSASTGGANADTLGGVGGAQTHTLITAEIPVHHHFEIGPTDGAGALSGWTDTGTNAVPYDTVTSDTGGGTAHSNTQPWIAINYIIFAQV